MSDPGETISEASTAAPGHEGRPAPDPAAKPMALDTDDTRAWHMKRILGSPWVIGLIVVLAAGAGAGGAIAGASAAIGAGAAAVVLLLALIAVFAIAVSAAARDFFSSYAEQRGLTLHDGRGKLPAVTPLLRKGDRRYCEHAMKGRLPGDFDGTLARFIYEVDTTDSDGDRQTAYYKFNVVVCQIPEASARLRELYVERRSGARFLDGLEDKFRRKTERVELESEALDRRYEIFHHVDDDRVYMREVFTPMFIDWLAAHAPKDFGFEFSSGTLCVSTKGHYDDAVRLDQLCEAAAEVRDRLHSEALENVRPVPQSPATSEPA